MSILYVFIGGAFGAVLRYLFLQLFKYQSAHIIGIFLINITGCFVIGVVSYLAVKRYNLISDNVNKLLTVGFAGGFTTFSAFTQPSLMMFLSHHYMHVFLNMFLSVIFGLIFVAWGMNCGYYLMNYLIRTKRLKLRHGVYD